MTKTKLLSIVAALLICVSFDQTASAESVKVTASYFASCKVSKNNANFFVSSTEKNIKLKKGTSLLWTIPDLNQGLIVVKAKIGKKWIKGEILMDDTTCR